jgi:ferredoxin
MKTHELTQITCGIKNMFGCVPGLQKVRYHLDAAKPEDFAEALVELFERIKPAITIVDAIISMEGQGPTNGNLRNSGFIVASTDTVAADAVCSMIMGYEALEILTTKIADDKGLGCGKLNDIELIGDQSHIIKDFKHTIGITSLINKIPKPLIRFLKPIISWIKVKPRINKKKCVQCMMCVNSCPAKAIDPRTFKIDEDKCIMCFCCRELCKYSAVDLKESLLWKIVNKATKYSI